jgi:hypothetical protein
LPCRFHSPVTFNVTCNSNPKPHRENPAQNDPQTTIFTYDESDTDLPTQNDTTDENPTQNDEISTETRTEQQSSDSETTCADYTQQTQLLPGTQANLAISPPNSPKTGSSHTETPSNSPPTAKFASGPLQRFSEAVSNILTPKTAKLPLIPASTDSKPQPTTSTHFSATTKILPKKNLPSRNSNPHPPNQQQNLLLSHNQENNILHPPPSKINQTYTKIIQS